MTRERKDEVRAEDLEMNRRSWDMRTPYHVGSAFYDVDAFVGGKCSLNGYERALLGDVAGQRLLHLQCHFGLDTLSLARRGATVTGLDFSPVAIDKARALADQVAQPEAHFVCADVHDMVAACAPTPDARFDTVFTSYGALGWLPDLRPWGAAIADCLRPGGRVVVVEFHPFLWIWDADFSKVVYPWDSAGVGIEEESTGTYADLGAPIEHRNIGWNHGVGTVVNALASAGLRVSTLHEYTRSPYNCFAHAERTDDGQYVIAPFGEGVPLVYGLVAERRL